MKVYYEGAQLTNVFDVVCTDYMDSIGMAEVKLHDNGGAEVEDWKAEQGKSWMVVAYGDTDPDAFFVGRIEEVDHNSGVTTLTLSGVVAQLRDGVITENYILEEGTVLTISDLGGGVYQVGVSGFSVSNDQYNGFFMHFIDNTDPVDTQEIWPDSTFSAVHKNIDVFGSDSINITGDYTKVAARDADYHAYDYSFGFSSDLAHVPHAEMLQLYGNYRFDVSGINNPQGITQVTFKGYAVETYGVAAPIRFYLYNRVRGVYECVGTCRATSNTEFTFAIPPNNRQAYVVNNIITGTPDYVSLRVVALLEKNISGGNAYSNIHIDYLSVTVLYSATGKLLTAPEAIEVTDTVAANGLNCAVDPATYSVQIGDGVQVVCPNYYALTGEPALGIQGVLQGLPCLQDVEDDGLGFGRNISFGRPLQVLNAIASEANGHYWVEVGTGGEQTFVYRTAGNWRDNSITIEDDDVDTELPIVYKYTKDKYARVIVVGPTVNVGSATVEIRGFAPKQAVTDSGSEKVLIVPDNTVRSNSEATQLAQKLYEWYATDPLFLEIPLADSAQARALRVGEQVSVSLTNKEVISIADTFITWKQVSQVKGGAVKTIIRCGRGTL